MAPIHQSLSHWKTLIQSFAQSPGLPFAGCLSQSQIEAACQKHQVQFGNTWTPILTLWTFLTQRITAATSCLAAVTRAAALMKQSELDPCSTGTGAYCKARAKLPIPFLQELAIQTGTQVDDQALDTWRHKGHRVLVCDGTTLTAPDTPANQAQYPQPSSQKPGLGFPILRMLLLLSYATGTCLAAAWGPYSGKKTGELALLRQLLDHFRPGDLFLADRGFDSFWLIAMLQERGVQVVIRMQKRKRSRGPSRGLDATQMDQLTTWLRPDRPDWMDLDTYQGLPEQLEVREITVRVAVPGYRVRSLTIVTTLLDSAQDPASELADLYRSRWQAELRIRDLKQTLHLDQLTCQTPDMLDREIWVTLLGYNLLRQVMAQAALAVQVTPREISLAAAKASLDAEMTHLALGGVSWSVNVRGMVRELGRHRVGNRRRRSEPRKVKRRPKSYPLLTRPRDEEREQLAHDSASTQSTT